MSVDCWQEVIDAYDKLFENDEGYDVIIYAGENENMEELHAHSIILRIRSQYFHAALSNEWAKKKDGKFILEKPNVFPNVLKVIIRFIYCGKIDLTILEGPDLFRLLMAVDELNIQYLIPRVEKHLIKYQYEFLYQNPLRILQTIYQNESFTSLVDFFFNKICENFVNSDKFITIQPHLLEFLLKRDDLHLEEVDIWDNLMRWIFAQHPNIPKDITKWNNEEVMIMERTLNRYIPLIRFYHISLKDLYDKVYPLKELLPKNLIDNLFKFPNEKTNIDKLPRRTKYDSVIIEFRHFALFASWIDKISNVYSRKIPYSFNLLYRASRDGDTIKTFHEKTDNLGASIVVAKIKNTNQMIGGYSPFDWSGFALWKATADSFIFSFEDYNNIETGKIGRVTNKKYAIYGHNNCGPVFGVNNNVSCDIMVRSNGKWSSEPHAYPDIGIPGNYEVENYEVFRVCYKGFN
ncbi:hypothetical protein C1646_810101 [Rhizophagus diaphanus]|nr:hypothetical protein C1646_810101 [Rhizophagus diaphanus] [Rhizophagus sp. MUCL 43196]